MLKRVSEHRKLGFWDRVGLWAGAVQTIGGLLVVGATEADVARVAAALDLIEKSDPLLYRRLPSLIERIRTAVLPGNVGQFNRRNGACDLDLRFVRDDASTPEIVASVIVHEATHARLARLGFEYLEDRRARIEMICVRRELAFLGRLPGGTPGLARVKSAGMPRPEDYTDAAFKAHHVVGVPEADQYIREALHKEGGMPRWLVEVVFVLRSGISAARHIKAGVGRLVRGREHH